MLRGANGLPDPTTVQTFLAPAATPIDLQTGPNGDLFYVDIAGGSLRRISFNSGNAAPNAVATASPTSGALPLTVQFDASGSSDPNPGDTISFSWDLDDNGVFGDSTSPTPTFTYTQAQRVTAHVRVTDNHGAVEHRDRRHRRREHAADRVDQPARRGNPLEGR